MTVQQHIQQYLDSMPQAKQADMRELDQAIRKLVPGSKLWFLDGTDETGKKVSNPSIGYGTYIQKYADGKEKEFYQIGMSAHTAGISVYIMGLSDRQYLAQHFGDTIGKATVTGYCIRFRSLKDIDQKILRAAIQHGIAETSAHKNS